MQDRASGGEEALYILNLTDVVPFKKTIFSRKENS